MNKFIRTPKAISTANRINIYERFNLKENPFPYNAYIEPLSDDPKRNGTIFSDEIRSKEINQFGSTFLEKPLDGNHDRLGYIIESSFTGRGNGKSAFLVNISRRINEDYGQSVSKDINKTFAVYLKASSGGNNSKFWQVSRDIVKEICQAEIISDCLLIIRYKVLSEEGMLATIEDELSSEDDFKKINDNIWLGERLSFPILNSKLKAKLKESGISEFFIDLIGHKPEESSKAINKLVSTKPDSWLKKSINDLLYQDLIRLFVLADFNGAYILLDEFEKIAESQKPSERIEFAHELRQKVLESSLQSGFGDFFTFILTMHPGTQRLLLEPWEQSGINARSPLPANEVVEHSHVLFFDDIKKEDIKGLLEVYLAHYRIDSLAEDKNGFYPFTDSAISLIAELAKFNAARILKISHLALFKLAKSDDIEIIDPNFISGLVTSEKSSLKEGSKEPSFLDIETNAIADSLKDIKFKDEK